MTQEADPDAGPSSSPAPPVAGGDSKQTPTTGNPPSPSPAVPTQDVAPWNKLAADLLAVYLFVHAAALAILAFYSLFGVLKEEEPIGGVYLDLMGLDIQAVMVWFVSPLLLAITFGAMWRVEMAKRRRRLVLAASLGIGFTLLLYISLMWLRFGDDLWQGQGPPDGAQFTAYVRNFTTGNLAVFVAVILGILGANLPEALRGNRP